MRLGSQIAVAVGRPVVTALIRPPPWEPPHAMGVALKIQKTNKQRNKKTPKTE